MARKWGDQENYPLRDTANLSRVMQYITTMIYDGDATSLKEEFATREFAATHFPDFGDPGQIHSILAGCDLPLYVTTNYDDFMYQALLYHRKRPKQDHGRWYAAGSVDNMVSPFTNPNYDPRPDEPLVFHLHGHYSVPKSLVLTEDDYIDYLVRLAGESFQRDARSQTGLLPNYVYSRLRNNPLLFVGYGLHDWTFLVLFRILLRGIPASERRRHVSVQIDPRERRRVAARSYIEQYLRSQSIQVFWESAETFAEKLKEKLEGTL